MKFIIVKELKDIVNNDINLLNNTRNTTVRCVKSLVKSKYERHIHIGGKNIILRYVKKLKKIVVTKRDNKRGKKKVYSTAEQRHEARKASKRNSYAKKVAKYKKDTDKRITDTLTKKDIIKATKDFYSIHYTFNYLLTPSTFFSLDKHDTTHIQDTDMYEYARNQDKYQIQKKHTTIDSCIRYIEYILSRLQKGGKKIFDNYYYVIHKSHYDNSYHPHILLNITDTSVKNIHTFIHNRTVGYWKKYQKRTTVKIHNIEGMLGYLNEEHKRNSKELLNIVYSDCNISKHSNRMVNQKDLHDNLDYSLNTYTHLVTINKLVKYGIRKNTA